MASNLFARQGIGIGLGLNYIPIARLEYKLNPDADFEIVDNVFWKPRLFYDFGNGFTTGIVTEIYSKSIKPAGSTKYDLSSWNLGAYGDYGYEITDSGHALLVGGMEIKYGQFTEKVYFGSRTAGAIGIAALAGFRYFFSEPLSMEFDYRIGWQEFDIVNRSEKKYAFSGSSIQLYLGYGF